jgi:hypothetical protein
MPCYLLIIEHKNRLPLLRGECLGGSPYIVTGCRVHGHEIAPQYKILHEVTVRAVLPTNHRVQDSLSPTPQSTSMLVRYI